MIIVNVTCNGETDTYTYDNERDMRAGLSELLSAMYDDDTPDNITIEIRAA